MSHKLYKGKATQFVKVRGKNFREVSVNVSVCIQYVVLMILRKRATEAINLVDKYATYFYDLDLSEANLHRL